MANAIPDEETIKALHRAADTIEIIVKDERRSVVATPFHDLKWQIMHNDVALLRGVAERICLHPDSHYSPPFVEIGQEFGARCDVCHKEWPKGKGRDDE